MKCPADSYSSNGVEIYSTFLEHVSAFKKLDALPVKIDFKKQDSVQHFMENRAKWHKACHLKFSRSKLLREQQREMYKKKRRQN